MTVGVDLVRVGHIPCATGTTVIVGHRLLGGRVLRLMRIKCVAVFVLRAADLARASCGIDLEHRVVGPVDVGINPHTEEMLMVVRVDTRVYFRTPTFRVLAGIHGIRVQDPRQLDFELNGAVLVEDPVDAVLVVSGGKDMRNEEFTAAGDDDRIVAEVGMFEEDPRIFFVDADGVFDGLAGSGSVDEVGVHVVDRAFAVAT